MTKKKKLNSINKNLIQNIEFSISNLIKLFWFLIPVFIKFAEINDK